MPEAKQLELEKATTMDDCMKQHMADLKKTNPDMSMDDMTAAAKKACAESMKSTEKAFTGMLSQDEVNYTPLSLTKGKACANCHWFMADMNCCHLVSSGMPGDEPILATGYCYRWETTPEPAMPETPMPMPIPVYEVEAPESDMMDMGKALEIPTVLKRLADALKPYFQKPSAEDAFTVFKDAANVWHWHAVFTNNFEDLEGEILTEKAHDKYIMRLDMGLIPPPELWAWHTPGSKHGEADHIWRNGHFVHAVGHFDSTPAAEKAITFYRKNAGKIKMSHGFTSPGWAFDGKQYHDYNTLEITTLPPKAAANPYTSFEELQAMTLTDEKRRYVEQVVGKDKLAEIEAADEQRSKALEDLKVAYKDYANPTTEDKPTTPTNDEPVRKAYLDLVQSQNDAVATLVLISKALQDERAQSSAKITALETRLDTETKAWQKELNDLRALVNQPPRRPSQDASTTVQKEDQLSDKLPAGDPLAQMFPGLIKQQGGAS